LLASIAPAVIAVNNADEGLQFKEVNDAAMRASAMTTLNGYLRGIGRDAGIRDCSILLWSRPGKIETIFGGLCRTRTGHSIIVCGDTGVGEFALSESFNLTKDGVVQFARDNCPGG